MAKKKRPAMRRTMPVRCIVLSVPQSEFIDAQKDELGITASDVVRRAMDFYIQYQIKPEIIARLIADQRLEEAERRRDEKKQAGKVKIAA